MQATGMATEFPAFLHLKPRKPTRSRSVLRGGTGPPCRAGEPAGDVMIIGVLLKARPGETRVAATPTTVTHPQQSHDLTVRDSGLRLERTDYTDQFMSHRSIHGRHPRHSGKFPPCGIADRPRRAFRTAVCDSLQVTDTQSSPTRHVRSRSRSPPRPRHDRRPFFPFPPVDGVPPAAPPPRSHDEADPDR
jgi:hypothetical protein